MAVTHTALVEAPPEVVAFLEELQDAGLTVTGVEHGHVAVEYDAAAGVPMELLERMNSIRMR